MLEADGRFVGYKGSSPDNKADQLWATSVSNKNTLTQGISLGFNWVFPSPDFWDVHALVTSLKDDRFYHIWESTPIRVQTGDTLKFLLEDDGNVAVHILNSSQSSSEARLTWQSNVKDPVVSYDMSAITYDLTKAKILGSKPGDPLILEAENHSDTEQTSGVSGNYTLSRTSGWANALAAKVSFMVKGKTGVPFVAEGEVSLTTEVQNTYTWNGSETKSESYSFTAALKLAPHEKGKVVVTCTNTQITVPFSGTGEILFKSGKRCSHRVEGIYEGINGHSIEAVYQTEKMPPRSLQLAITRVHQ